MGKLNTVNVISDLQDNPRFLYLLDFLNGHPAFTNWEWKVNAKNADIQIGYLPKSEKINPVFIVKYDPTFFKINESLHDRWTINSYQHNNKVVYGIDQSNARDQPLVRNNLFHTDIFNTIFFLISRYEEVFAKKYDKNQAGWLDEKKHLLVRAGIMETPVVDQLCNIIADILEKNTSINNKIKSTYSLSHDIDIIYRFRPFGKFLKSLVATIWYKRGWQHLRDIIRHYIMMLKGQQDDPYNSFSWLLRDENLWQNQYLFLMTGGNSAFDNKYNIDDEVINEIIRVGRKKGYTIGIHPSYNAYNDKHMFTEEVQKLKDKLGKSISINRQHWLRWDWEITPYLIEEAGIKTDSSIGYNNHLGFRCGTGFPYRLYDFQNERPFNFMEEPLAYMESSAIHYCRNNDKEIMEVSESFLMKNKHHTRILFNFHNSNFDPTTADGQKLNEFYRHKLIEIIAE